MNVNDDDRSAGIPEVEAEAEFREPEEEEFDDPDEPAGEADPLAPLRIVSIGRSVTLLVWDGEPARRVHRLGIDAGGVPLSPPWCHAVLPLVNGFARNLLAVSIDEAAGLDGSIGVCDEEGEALAVGDIGTIGEADIGSLLDGLAVAGPARLVRFLLEACAPMFQLDDDPTFVDCGRRALAQIVPAPMSVNGRCTVVDRFLLAAAEFPFGPVEGLRAIVVAGDGVRRSPLDPLVAASGDRHSLCLLLPLAAAVADAWVVLLSDVGVAALRLDGDDARPPAVGDWLRTAASGDKHLLRYLVECLATLGRGDEEMAALLREVWRHLSAGGITVNTAGAPLAAGAELFLDCDAGTLVGGWFRDPYRLLAGLSLERDMSARDLPIDRVFRLPAEGGRPAAGADQEPDWRFVAFFPASSGWPAAAPCRLALRLHSGLRLACAEGPSMLPPADARAAVLNLVRPGRVTEPLLTGCLEPALRSLQAEISGRAAACQTIEIRGLPARPVASVVIPLIDRPDILRCRTALFATDPAMAQVEVIYVVDDARLWCALEPAVRDLLATYGLGARIVVCARGVGAAVALNAGAAVARGPVLAFLGGAVLPEEPGWIAAMSTVLGAQRQCGVVGGRVLFEDDSLGHAGAEIAVDDTGAWTVRRRFAGFPRNFAAAAGSGPVPVVSSACLMTDREMFSEVGGFDPEYLTGVYVDADFCFKIRQRGFSVWHAAQPALFDLADGAAGDDRDVAALLDRWHLTRNWRKQMEDEGDDTGGEAASSARRPRRQRVSA
jgi:hypothetical protein